MEITRLISNGNPNSIKKQRHSQLLSHINTSATLHHSHKEQFKTTSQPNLIQTQQQQSPTTHVHHHHHHNNNNNHQQQQLPRILSPVQLSQQPSHTILIPSPIPLHHHHHHHQQSIPTPPQSTQIPLMDLQHPPPQSQQSQPQTHTPPSRRIAHILSEQKRRENINSGFEELKSIVPSCRGCADSKAVILRKAVHYIQTLESEIQKLKQPSNSPTTPNASTTAPSPAMSVKSAHNTNGNLSLPSITTLPQMQIHGNATGSSVFTVSDFNNQEKNGHLLEHQKHQQQYMSQWQTMRMSQNYEPSSPTHQSNYQHRQLYHQQMHNHQKSFTHPVPRHHSQYAENINWNTAGDGDYY